MDANQIVNITYTNYNHQTRTYRIIPTKIEFTKSQWHPEEQWILIAFDLDRNCERWFAMKDIQTWGKGESDLFDGVTPEPRTL